MCIQISTSLILVPGQRSRFGCKFYRIYIVICYAEGDSKHSQATNKSQEYIYSSITIIAKYNMYTFENSLTAKTMVKWHIDVKNTMCEKYSVNTCIKEHAQKYLIVMYLYCFILQYWNNWIIKLFIEKCFPLKFNFCYLFIWFMNNLVVDWKNVVLTSFFILHNFQCILIWNGTFLSYLCSKGALHLKLLMLILTGPQFPKMRNKKLIFEILKLLLETLCKYFRKNWSVPE